MKKKYNDSLETLKLLNTALRLSDGEISTEDALSISCLELMCNSFDDDSEDFNFEK